MLFPKWINKLRVLLAGGALVAVLYVVLVVAYGASPQTTDVGYSPAQPIPYSHALHAGELGIDCRYCHNTVESAAHAAIPPAQTCINCHSKEYGIRVPKEAGQTNAKLQPLLESYYGSERTAAGLPIPWVRVHDLPNYVYFNHSAHVNRGVSCVECHGRVDKMQVVYQAKALSMSWCLDCHRNPGPQLRPADQITNMNWKRPAGEEGRALAERLLREYNIRPFDYLQQCSVCHR